MKFKTLESIFVLALSWTNIYVYEWDDYRLLQHLIHVIENSKAIHLLFR